MFTSSADVDVLSRPPTIARTASIQIITHLSNPTNVVKDFMLNSNKGDSYASSSIYLIAHMTTFDDRFGALVRILVAYGARLKAAGSISAQYSQLCNMSVCIRVLPTCNMYVYKKKSI
jgi:hypothetical protein